RYRWRRRAAGAGSIGSRIAREKHARSVRCGPRLPGTTYRSTRWTKAASPVPRRCRWAPPPPGRRHDLVARMTEAEPLLRDDYSGSFDPTVGLADFSRKALAPL